MGKILITGASGIVGTKLSELLFNSGYKINVLSRNPQKSKHYNSFRWDIENEFIDELAFDGIDGIIHLAGENIGEGFWTAEKMKRIIDSRVNSAKLLYSYISKLEIKLRFFVSASAIGYYDSYYDDSPIFSEESKAGSNFTSKVCTLWEATAELFKSDSTRVVKIRTGLVQDKSDPALKKMLLSAKFGVLPIMGTGKQYYSWIHIFDLCQVYKFAVENVNCLDVVNAVAPEIITNKEYVKTLKQYISKPCIIVKLPVWFLKIAFGKKSEILYKGAIVKSLLHDNRTFKFKYPRVEDAFKQLL